MIYTLTIESKSNNPSDYDCLKLGSKYCSILGVRDGDAVEQNREFIKLLKECRETFKLIFDQYEHEQVDDILDEMYMLFTNYDIEDETEILQCECGWTGSTDHYEERNLCPHCDEDLNKEKKWTKG